MSASVRRLRLAAGAACVSLVAMACGSTAYQARIEARDGAGAATEVPGLSDESPAAADQVATSPSGGPTAGSTASPAPGASGPVDPGTRVAPTTGPDGTQPTRPPVPPSLPQSTANGRGVTDTTVKVGFILLDSFQNLGANLGFSIAPKGDVRGQVRAMADWINERGGIAGRNIEPILRVYQQEEASAGAEAQLCHGFADDDGVWAVVLQGQIHESSKHCYAAKGVLMIDPFAFAVDDDLMAQLSPWLWSPSYPNYTSVARTLPYALDDLDYFAPMASRGETSAAVGVLHWDMPTYRRVLEQDLKPALAAVGITNPSTYGVDAASVASIQHGLSQAIVQFRDDNVNRVLFVGSAPLAPFFFSTAEGNEFRPRYGISSLEHPRHASSDRGSPPQMVDAVGIGFNFGTDILDVDAPPPATDQERDCLRTLAAAGHTFEARENSDVAMAFCSAVVLLHEGGRTINNGLTGPLWAIHAEQLHAGPAPAFWWEASFGPGDHDGAEQYRTIAHDPDCGCFHYTSELRSFR